jgi:hypothetical protein
MGTGGMYSRVEDTSESREALQLPLASHKQRLTKRSLFGLQIFLFVGAVTFFVMLYKSFAFSAVVGCVSGAVGSASKSASHDIPQYYQTKPELFAGQYIYQTLLDQILMLSKVQLQLVPLLFWHRSIPLPSRVYLISPTSL